MWNSISSGSRGTVIRSRSLSLNKKENKMIRFLKVLLLVSGLILFAIIIKTPGTQLVESIIAGIMLWFAIELKD